MKADWHPVKLTEVEGLIAESFWEYRERGRTVVARVAIGHPHPNHAFFHDVTLTDIRDTRRKVRPTVRGRKASGKPPRQRKR